MRRMGERFGLVVALMCSSACVVHSVRSANTATERFQGEYSCPDAESRELGGGAVRVTGCGWNVTYVCEAVGEVTCVKESERREGEVAATTRSSEPKWPTAAVGEQEESYDRFKQIRVFAWKNIVARDPDGERSIVADFFVVTEEGGRMLSRDDAQVVMRLRRPGEAQRYTNCQSLDFLVGGAPVAAGELSFRDGAVHVPFSVDQFETMARTSKIEGRLCGDEFLFDPNQMLEMGRFWLEVDRQLEKAESSTYTLR